MPGIDPQTLPDEDLLRELESLYRTRLDTLRFGSPQALEEHTARLAELEREYLRRFPEREVDPDRLRDGARQR
jgi:hypothetical protein